MTASETIRIRVDPDFKEAVTRMYQRRGTTVSQAVRTFLAGELSASADATDAFDAIMASADAKAKASGLGEPTIGEINDYIARARANRAAQSLAAL